MRSSVRRQRMTGMGEGVAAWAGFVWLLLSVLAASSSLGDVIFSQNYDTDTLGSDAGWESVSGAELTRTVVSSEYTSPNHSLELAHLTPDVIKYAHRHFAPTASNPQIIRVSHDVKWVNTGDPGRPYFGWRFLIGSYVHQGYVHDVTAMIVAGNQVWNGGDGIGFFARELDGTKQTILSFPGELTAIPGNWWHVAVTLYYEPGPRHRTYDVTVNQLTGGSASGTLTGLAFRGAGALTPDQVGVVWFDNGDVADTPHSLFIDNLLVEAIPVSAPSVLFMLGIGALLMLRHRRV